MSRWPRRTFLHIPAPAVVLVAALSLSLAFPAEAGNRERARRIHDRLAGVPPDAATLQTMQDLLDQDTPEADLLAAEEAMKNHSFYNVVLKNWVTPWTNVAGDVFAELNDYTATVIGTIRDGLPFTDVLQADRIYVGSDATGVVSYSHTNNTHYQQLEELGIDLGDPAMLVPVTQSGLPGARLVESETAGIITTRAAAEAFFSAGTNRRMWRFIGINYLCRDMEQLHDITRPVDRIRQDVSRSPGGDSSLFQNNCSGCHSGMDALAGAFAYYEWDPETMRLEYTRGEVQPKYLINDNTFPFGYITVDDSWVNYWRTGPNSALGWGTGPSSGFGAKSLGREVAESRAFSICQVEKVFQHVCFRPPGSLEDVAAVERIADVFEAEQYDMKRVFAEVALYCTADLEEAP